MKYKIDNKIYKIDLEKLEKLGSGNEANVYKFNNLALKIFNSTRLKYGYALSEDKFIKMSRISLDRIIMPIDLVYENNKFVGYTMELLEHKLPLKHLFNKNIIDIIDEIKILESDIDVLSDYEIKMYDFMNNFFYNGNINIIDISYYYEYHDFENVTIHNKISINDFFIYNLLLKPVSNNLNLKQIPFNSNFLLSFFDKNIDISNLDFSTFLLELSKQNKINTINDIQKKYVKKYIKDFIK